VNNQPEPLKKIKNLLRFHRNGLSITDIAEKLRLNRNSAAKYLEILLISGDVNLNTFGPAKVYTYSKRMPISAMLKFSADIILLIDNELHVLDANENALSVLGLSREDLIGNPIGNVKSPLIARLDIPNIFEEIQAKGEIQRDFSITLQDQDYHYRMRLIPTVFDNMDEGLTIFGEDISEQIRFEERLMVSEARFRAIVEDQIDFICRFHPDGTITFINEPLSRYLGSSLNKVCGQNLFSFIVPDDHILARDMLQRITRSHQAQAGEIRILDGNGQFRWYQWFIRGIYDKNGALIECQSVDVISTPNGSRGKKSKRAKNASTGSPIIPRFLLPFSTRRENSCTRMRHLHNSSGTTSRICRPQKTGSRWRVPMILIDRN
jgi:PAS domain S-box-containing protein